MEILFKEISDQEALAHIDRFLQEMYTSLLTNPYNHVYLIYKGELKHPILGNDIKTVYGRVQGFIWIELSETGAGNLGKITQLATKNNASRTSVFKMLINKYVSFCKRNVVKSHYIEAPTAELQILYSKIGYKPSRMIMEGHGDIEEFIDVNKILSYIVEGNKFVEQTKVEPDLETVTPSVNSR
jgi:hypothetical protein